MFGILKDVANGIGEAVGTVAGIAVAPIALALDCSEAMVQKAIKAGCRTQNDIKRWVDENE